MNYSVTGEQLTSIANAIRGKTGETGGLSFPTEFVSEIGNISTTPTIKTGVVFSVTPPTQGGVTIKKYGTDPSSVRSVLPLSGDLPGGIPPGKMWVIKSVTEFKVYGESQTLSDFVFVQHWLDTSGDRVFSKAHIYTATGEDITISKPSSSSPTSMYILADVFEIDRPQ